MQTSLTELPDSRVSVEVEVPAEDVARATSRAARAMAKEMRMPGFREGKAPPSLVIQRLGFGPVLEEAIREALPEWYERALLDSRVSPIGDPSIEMVSTPEGEGEPLAFKFEVGVRPAAKLGEYKGLEVGKAETEVSEDVDRHRGRAGPRGLRPAGAGRARGRRGRLAADRLRGLDRRHRLRGRQGRGLPAGARLGLADRGLRGAAERRQGGRGASRSRSPSPTTTRRSTWPAKTRSSTSR